MFDWGILDLAIGLSFTYLILSLICTTVVEAWASARRLRPRNLQRAIHLILGAPPPSKKNGEAPDRLAGRFYAHPLIQALAPAGRHPSYIAPATFAKVVQEIIREDAAKAEKRGALEDDAPLSEFLADWKPPSEQDGAQVKTALVAALRGAKGAAEENQRLEDWFNATMERSTGWYKRDSQLHSAVIALLLTVMVNADTLQMAERLWSNPTLRAAVLESAKERAKNPPVGLEYPDPDNPEPSTPVASTTDGDLLTDAERQALADLTGWSEEFRGFNRRVAELRVRARFGDDAPKCLQARRKLQSGICVCQKPADAASCQEASKLVETPCCKAVFEELHSGRNDASFPGRTFFTNPGITWDWLLWLLSMHTTGWLLTAAAVSLGAPFWFQQLQTLMKLRGAGVPQETGKAVPAGGMKK
jgi:hypothetical protein